MIPIGMEHLARSPRIGRAWLSGDDTTRFRVRRAVTPEDLTSAGRLLLAPPKGWETVGGVPLSAVRMAQEETAVLMAEIGDRPVAALAVVRDSVTFGLPGDAPFGRALACLRSMGRQAAEMVGCAAPDAAFPVWAELARAAAAVAAAGGADDLFCGCGGTVFDAVVLFEPWGDRPTGRRLSLSCLADRAREADRRLGRRAFLVSWLLEANPYVDYARFWQIMNRRTFGDPMRLRELVAGRLDLLARLTDRERTALRERWGGTLFRAVCRGDTTEISPA